MMISKGDYYQLDMDSKWQVTCFRLTYARDYHDIASGYPLRYEGWSQYIADWWVAEADCVVSAHVPSLAGPIFNYVFASAWERGAQ